MKITSEWAADINLYFTANNRQDYINIRDIVEAIRDEMREEGVRSARKAWDADVGEYSPLSFGAIAKAIRNVGKE